MSILSGASLTSGTQNKGRLIGVTGPMAAGKNAAADILCAKGFTVLDADEIAHDVLNEQKDRICKLFAHDAQKALIPLIDGEGNILRKNLARIVFRDPQKLALLENLIHPAVNDIIEKRIAASSSESFVVNAALLYNIKVIKKCDCILYIDAPFFIRFMRVKKRDKLNALRIIERFFAQRQIFAKCKNQNADIYRVRNCGTKERLQAKIEAVLQLSVHKG